MRKMNCLALLAILLLQSVSSLKVVSKNSKSLSPGKMTFIEIPMSKIKKTTEEHKKDFDHFSNLQSFLMGSQTDEKMISMLNTDSQNPTASGKDVPLYNHKNTQYTGEISFSNSDNAFKVILDTGSANIWINSRRCTDPGCLNHKQYDYSKSAHFKAENLPLSVQFGTGALKGVINKDTAFLGGVEVPDQSFAEITNQMGNVFVQGAFDGIVGLAFPSMAAYHTSPIFDTIISKKLVSHNMFSFYFSRSSDDYSGPLLLNEKRDNNLSLNQKNQEKRSFLEPTINLVETGAKRGYMKSVMTVGGYDEDRFDGELNWHAISDPFYWTVKADKILVNGKDTKICEGCNVVMDTGTSVMTGPRSALESLFEKVSVNKNCDNADKLPTITFVIDGKHYDLTHEDYILSLDAVGNPVPYNKSHSGQCVASFMPLDIPSPHGPGWILGDTFLSKYYSVYDRDNKRVGLALAK